MASVCLYVLSTAPKHAPDDNRCLLQGLLPDRDEGIVQSCDARGQGSGEALT